MQELSLTECQMVASQVPFWPGSQLVEPPGHGAPMLQTPGLVQAQAKTAHNPQGLPLQQLSVGSGITFPPGRVTLARAAVENSR
jgi:hypothetical protein